MRTSLFIVVIVLILTFTLEEVNAKTKQKTGSKTDKEATKKSSQNTEDETQEKAEEKPAFEKARIRYTKPKSDKRAKEETTKNQAKQQDGKYTSGKKQKTVDAARDTKNKYKQAPVDHTQKVKKLKKQEKYTKAAGISDEAQEQVVPDRKTTKDKRPKREIALEKEKLKKVNREEVGVEEHSVEVCPPCNCGNNDGNLEHLSNVAKEEVTATVETEEETQEEEQADEALQCDSLVEGCDV